MACSIRVPASGTSPAPVIISSSLTSSLVVAKCAHYIFSFALICCRILLSTNKTGSGGKEARKLVTALCSITQRELSCMQTQICNAVHMAYNRYQELPVSATLTAATVSEPKALPLPLAPLPLKGKTVTPATSNRRASRQLNKQRLCSLQLQASKRVPSDVGVRQINTVSAQTRLAGVRKLEMA